ncbi:carboxymuconolactone decarboxylase family protein [Microbulbifer sp. TYP-18]|uniref:carboxymuconolactone decarboxylase family protein n=1 Tax=Microbulbifer sp. TYP-18 TaxID=3230024 RepID=UPI0034C5C16A
MPNEAKTMTYDAFRRTQKTAHDALITLGKSVDEGGLEKDLTELVKLRVSQINSCAFCIQLHLNIARKLGVDEVKLGLLAAWCEAGVFSAREQAALSWAEQLTQFEGKSTSEAEQQYLRESFQEHEIVLLTVTIGTINAWNRIARGLVFDPPV